MLTESFFHAAINSTAVTYPNTVTLNCYYGYHLPKNQTELTCDQQSEWSPPPSQCKVVSCPAMTSFKNATTVTVSGNTVNSTATFTCNIGYARRNVSTSTKTCVHEKENLARWSGSPLPCLPVICPHLSAPVNGIVTGDLLSFGAIAEYRCSPGYQITPAKTRVCLGNNSWSGVEPKCTGKVFGLSLPHCVGKIFLN